MHGGWSDPCWDDEQAAVFRAADELHETSTLSDEAFGSLERHFGAEQILELLATAGWYHLIAYVCRAARLATEAWAERFPEPAAASPAAPLR